MNDSHSPLPQLPVNSPDPVPVFNCHVILSVADENGRRCGRVANLEGIEVAGTGEREILMAITRQFKAFVKKYHDAGRDIPWIEPPATARPGELERFVPVHL
ncbi:MAG: hypothetical protein R3C19_13835 [Planctomycetaceae bacterium]